MRFRAALRPENSELVPDPEGRLVAVLGARELVLLREVPVHGQPEEIYREPPPIRRPPVLELIVDAVPELEVDRRIGEIRRADVHEEPAADAADLEGWTDQEVEQREAVFDVQVPRAVARELPEVEAA